MILQFRYCRSKINKITKIVKELFNQLNIDFVISKQPLNNNDLSLFSDEGEFLIYVYESNKRKNYSFINQNEIKVECKKNLTIDIPLNYSKHWKNSKDIEITKNDYGGMSIDCNNSEFSVIRYKPRLYRLQPQVYFLI